VVDSDGLNSSPESIALTIGLPPPRISAIRLSRTRFCVKKSLKCPHPGTEVSFTLSRASPVELAVKHNGKTLVQHTLNGKAGKNARSFAGAGLKPKATRWS